MLDYFQIKSSSLKLDDDATLVTSRRFAQAIIQTEFLTKEREVELIQLAKAGDLKARDLVILAHMRMALKIAIPYTRIIKTGVVTREDIIQEVAIALCHALHKFDPSENVRFATYAVWWIRSHAQEVVHRNNHHLHLSSSRGVRQFVTNYTRDKIKLRDLGLTDEEQDRLLAKRYKLGYDVVKDMGPVLISKPLELDSTLEFEEGTSENRQIEDTAPLPDSLVEKTIDGERVTKALKKAMETLKPREQYIIKNRYLKENEQTLESIGQKLGISKERVRQIQLVALEKLREILEKEA